MPPLQIPGGAQLKLYWTLSGGGVMENVIGAQITGASLFGQAMANTLDSAIKGSFTSSAFSGHIHTGVSLAAVGIKDLRNPSLTEFIGQGASVAGTATGDALPRNVAFVVTLRTSLSGQRYRGRIYYGGFSEADNESDATAVTTTSTTAVAFTLAIGAALTSNGMGLGVISRPAEPTTTTIVTEKNDGTTETDTKHTVGRPGLVTPVTLVQARNDTWDSQRRRSTPGSISTLFRPSASGDLVTGEVRSFDKGELVNGLA